MLFRRRSVLLFAMVAGFVLDSSPASAACPATVAASTAFVPPAPYPVNADDGWFLYGTGALWTRLPPQDWAGGYWAGVASPQKLFVWSPGFDWRTAHKPYLKITGKRLDGEAPPIEIAGGTNAGAGGMSAMLIGVSFPAEGCWQLTVDHDGHTLNFVVRVAP